jgi:predicted nucleotidyltransferase
MEQRLLLSSIEKKRQVVEDLKRAVSAKKEIIFAFVYGSFNDYTDNLPFRDVDVGVYVTGMGQKDSVYYSLDLSDRLSTLIQLPVEEAFAS